MIVVPREFLEVEVLPELTSIRKVITNALEEWDGKKKGFIDRHGEAVYKEIVDYVEFALEGVDLVIEDLDYLLSMDKKSYEILPGAYKSMTDYMSRLIQMTIRQVYTMNVVFDQPWDTMS